MKLGPLHHIGCVVPSLDEARRSFTDRLGGTLFGEPIIVDDDIARIGFVQMPGVLMEFIEPIAPDTELTAFLAQHPDGAQHHFCHQVEDITAGRALYEAAGAEMTSPIMTGVLGLLIFFMKLPDLPGLLIEIIEVK